jgi:hypothetical protein
MDGLESGKNPNERLRRGIGAPEPILWLEINPAFLPENQRQLIYNYLLETDVEEGMGVTSEHSTIDWARESKC